MGAIGVAPSGGPGEALASTLTRGRSHRLETVDPALFHELSLAEQPAVDAYVRQITQQVAFSSGPELSATAQSAARTLLSGRWPSEAEWSALRTEYDSARMMAGSAASRPGRHRGTRPNTHVPNRFRIVPADRNAAVLEDGSAPDVVYAARAAGVRIALSTAV